MSVSVQDQAMAFMHVADEGTENCIQLGTYSANIARNRNKNKNSSDIDSDSYSYSDPNIAPSQLLPRTDMNRIILSTCSTNTIIGRCHLPGVNVNELGFQSDKDKDRDKDKDKDAIAIPSFKWRCIVLLRRAIKDPVNLQIGNSRSKFLGAYFPNDDLCLFKDVYSISKGTFPLSIKFTLPDAEPEPRPRPRPVTVTTPVIAPEAEVETTVVGGEENNVRKENENNENEVVEAPVEPVTVAISPPVRRNNDTCLLLRVSRAGDRKVVYETRGRGMVQLFNIQINDFLNEGEDIPVRAEADAGGGGKGGKDKKGGGSSSGDTDASKLLIELFIDDSAMNIPDIWRSSMPYRHKTHTAPLKLPGAPDPEEPAAVEIPEDGVGGVLHNVKLTTPQFLWAVDVMAGTVTEVNGDTFDLHEMNENKTLWEESGNDRSTKAAAALAYFKEAKELAAARAMRAMHLQAQQETQQETQQEGEGEVSIPISVSVSEKDLYITESLMANMITALGSLDEEKEKEEVAARHNRLLPSNTPQYMEHYSGNESNIGLDAILLKRSFIREQALKRRRDEDNSKKRAAEGVADFGTYNETLRVQVGSRIGELVKQAYSVEQPPLAAPVIESADKVRATTEGEEEAKTSTENTEKADNTEAVPNDDASSNKINNNTTVLVEPSTVYEWWQQREKYRKYNDHFNESLAVLLVKSTDAIDNALVAEGGGDPKKGKKK